MNKVPTFWCWSCMDHGLIEILDQSTDALLYHRQCQCKTYPMWKVYSKEVTWKPTEREIAAAPPF